VAVGAPDEDSTSAAVLDQERELQNILDAVEPAQRQENTEVRILEVGHPEVIAQALAHDAYHVLHVSCHGLPGALELEDEGGRAVRTTADQLLAPIRGAGRPLPLVLLNSCHGGSGEGQAVSFAEALLRGGVPGVVAMQTSVSDHYATQLARAFYENLARRETLLPSRALAEARKTLEQRRQQALQGDAALERTQPEYATASLFVAGEERPLANFGLDKQPLRVRPVYEVSGPPRAARDAAHAARPRPPVCRRRPHRHRRRGQERLGRARHAALERERLGRGRARRPFRPRRHRVRAGCGAQ
jgi:CHAT domain-containing protein